jgi:hypothetical protein
MSIIKSILTTSLVIVIVFTTISFSTLNLEAKKSKDEVAVNIAKQQSELVDNLPNGKKQLKKKLALEYTNSKFETDLNSEQKLAILQSLKKWKGELPVNNRFTVTSLADIKSNTNDSTKQSKKKNSNTPNSKVVYMWASIPNPNLDNNTPYDAEDYEEGDPRFINPNIETQSFLLTKLQIELM